MMKNFKFQTVYTILLSLLFAGITSYKIFTEFQQYIRNSTKMSSHRKANVIEFAKKYLYDDCIMKGHEVQVCKNFEFYLSLPLDWGSDDYIATARSKLNKDYNMSMILSYDDEIKILSISKDVIYNTQ